MKRLIRQTILATALLMVAMPVVVKAQFLYSTNGINTITITDYTGYGGAVTIPSIIDGYTVVSIGGYALNGSSLTSVTIPDSVTNIGMWAFSGCGDLTSISIGTNVTHIGEFAFWNCVSLASVTIPSSVSNIDDSAFFACSSLISVTIPNSVTNLGNHVFSYCDNLDNMTIPGSILGEDLGDKLGNYPSHITLGPSVIEIPHDTFFGWYFLKSVTIPTSVTSIGDGAFGATHLESITIPNGVTNIGNTGYPLYSSR